MHLHVSFWNMNSTLCFKFNYIYFGVTIIYLLYFCWIDQWKLLMLFLFNLSNFKTKQYTNVINHYQMDQKNNIKLIRE